MSSMGQAEKQKLTLLLSDMDRANTLLAMDQNAREKTLAGMDSEVTQHTMEAIIARPSLFTQWLMLPKDAYVELFAYWSRLPQEQQLGSLKSLQPCHACALLQVSPPCAD